MRHSLPLCAIVVFAISVGMATAQIVVDHTCVPNFWEEFEISWSDSSAVFSAGESGENRTWTFGDYPWLGSRTETWEDPAGTPFAPLFPTATHAVYGTRSDNPPGGYFYVYFRVTEEEIFRLGDLDWQDTTIYDPEILLGQFPMQYGDTSAGVNYRDEWPGGSRIDSAVSIVDGWGRATTPFVTDSALRIFTHHWVIEQFDPNPPDTVEYVAYNWLGCSLGGPVFSVRSEYGVVDPNFTSGRVQMMTSRVFVDPVRSPVVQSFTLAQNYPNPFNSATQIEFTLARAGWARLEVVDLLGRSVATLTNRFYPAGGYTVPFDASQFASGVYLYRLRAGEASSCKKMLFIR